MSEKKTETLVMVNPKSSELPHNRYHRAAKSSAAMAIVYAAMAGRELMECRKKIKHGGWDKWVAEHCEFDRTTAWRYMELAEKLKSRLNEFTTRAEEKTTDVARVQHLVLLLDRPPSELLPAETESLLTDLREATKGETLRQLYFDFGIASAPKPVGGPNHLNAFLKEHFPDHPEYIGTPLRELPKEVQTAWKKHLPDEKETTEIQRMGCQARWRLLIAELRREALERKTYAWLTHAELEELHGTLIDVKKEISEALKK